MFVDVASGAVHIRAFEHTLQSATQTRPAALQSARQLALSGLDNFYLYVYLLSCTE